MPEYIDYPVETNPEVLAEDAFEELRRRISGWVPNDGNLETIIIEILARMSAEVRDLASRVPVSIFRYYGSTLLNIFPIDATPASADSTWSVRDNLGYLIPAGTQVGIRRTGSDLIPFYVLNDVTIPPGQTVTALGEVTLIATEEGAIGSGLTQDPELIDPLDFVTDIGLVGITTGGVDAEPDDVYLARLIQQLRLMAPRPILPQDFAMMAENVPGVDRALVIDLWNPYHNLLPQNDATMQTNVGSWAVSGTGFTAARSTVPRKDNHYALAITIPGAAAEVVVPNGYSVDAPPGEAFQVAAWAASSDAVNANLRLTFRDYSGAVIGTVDGAVTPVPGQTWTELRVAATAPMDPLYVAEPAGQNSMRISVVFHDVTQTIDDFGITEIVARYTGAGYEFSEGYTGTEPNIDNNQRMITVVPIDVSGAPVSAQVKQQLDDYLQGHREINFLVYVIDPSYITIDVSFDLICFPNYLPDDVRTRTIEAIQAYLNPGNWGRPVGGDPREWIRRRTIRYLELAEVVNGVQGVDYILDLRLGLADQELLPQDLILGGQAPLPLAGTITGTVAVETLVTA